MTTLVSVNGKIVTPERATVSVFDRGFLYGDSVFEALRTYGGRPCALELHMARLERSASRVFIDLPLPLHELSAEVRAAVLAAKNPESNVRIMLTRGIGDRLGLDPALGRSPSRFVIVTELVPLAEELYTQGVSVITYRTQRVTDSTAAAGAKIANYLTAVLAMHDAREKAAHEALIVDVHGYVVEGATSNVFAVKNGALVTPPESAGILVGITRGLVIDAARDLGIEVAELPLTPAQLISSDEAFISSSIREVVPVVRVDGESIGSGKPGLLTLELLRRYREKIVHSA